LRADYIYGGDKTAWLRGWDTYVMVMKNADGKLYVEKRLFLFFGVGCWSQNGSLISQPIGNAAIIVVSPLFVNFIFAKI
jgi:hypothetical protein